MVALITGASSGIGRDIARILSKRYGCDLILVARRMDRLQELKKELPTRVQAIACDLSKDGNCQKLYKKLQKRHIDILVNNAGFGLFGAFDETDLERELQMIDTNIKALHILTKLYLRDFLKRDRGYILNVASSAAFVPGPLLSSYYASKAYVLRLSEGIQEEIRRKNSRVSVTVLCPGPVNTEFNQVAKVKFAVPGLSSERVAQYGVQEMFRRKDIAVPGLAMKIVHIGRRFLPERFNVWACYYMQMRKTK